MAVAAIAFFLPWIQLFPPASKKSRIGSIGISVRKSMRLSGFEIPKAANSEAAKTAVQLAELFNKKSDIRTQLRQAGQRTYAVYLLPFIHFGLGLILLRQKQVHWLVGVAGFTAFLIAPIVFWQAKNTLAQSNSLAAMDYGLRLSLLAYWGLTFAAARILREARGA